MDPTQLALSIGVTFLTAAVAVVMAVTLYTMVRQPHLRPGLEDLLLVALPSQLICGTLLCIVISSQGIVLANHQTAVGTCVCILWFIGLFLGPLLLLHVFYAPQEERVPRPLTVAHAVIWVCPLALVLVFFLCSGGF